MLRVVVFLIHVNRVRREILYADYGLVTKAIKSSLLEVSDYELASRSWGSESASDRKNYNGNHLNYGELSSLKLDQYVVVALVRVPLCTASEDQRDREKLLLHATLEELRDGLGLPALALWLVVASPGNANKIRYERMARLVCLEKCE